MAEGFGDHERSMLVQAITSGANSDPGYDSIAETSAASDSKGSQGDIQEDFGGKCGTEAIAFVPMNAKQFGKNGVPFQVRLVTGMSGESFQIVKKQMYIPAMPVIFNGETVTPTGRLSGTSPTLGGWNDVGLAFTNAYLEITIDNTEGDWCDPKTYKYTKPKCTAKWQTSHTETKVTEGKIVYSVALCTDIPAVVDGKVTSNQYKHVTATAVDVVDPFIHASHMIDMDVVTDIRFEDTGSEIKCHITRARVACLKLYNEDGTPKEDYKLKDENFSKVSDSEIPRVMKMQTTRIATNVAYSGHQLTQAVYEDIRIIQKEGGTDPNTMSQASSRTEAIFTATPHSAEHV